MEKFIVSARKYRPQHFNTVVGQSHITTTLKNAIASGHLAHAFLFCGPRGVGKTTCARILAKTINCTNKTAETEACDTCNSCKSFNDGTSLNIHELDAASNNGVDDMRQLVEQVRFAPQAGDFKVYIIDEVHMLSTSAFNAFLKTLEEPPAHAKFILATTEKHKILPTILSRCQIFDFKRITTADTVEHLQEICNKETVQAEIAALQLIAQKSEGCMRDALSIMDKIVSFTNGVVKYNNTLEHLNILDEAFYFQFLEHFTTQNLPDTLLLFDEINKKGFEGDTVLLGLAEFFRNILVCKDEKAAILLESIESFRKKYIAIAKETNANWLISALQIITDAVTNYKMARNKKLHVEMTLLKLCFLDQALEATLNEQNVVYKKKLHNQPQLVKSTTLNSLLKYQTQKKLTEENTIEPAVYIEQNQPSKPNPAFELTNEKSTTKTALGLKQLKNVKNQVANKLASTPVLEQKNLTLEEVKKVWFEMAAEINKDGNNSTTQTTLEMAQLSLVNENTFLATLSSNVQLKVVEKFRKDIMAAMQNYFNNKNIAFSIEIDDSISPTENIETVKSKRAQYEEMIQQYPLVQKLKDQLGLELDY
jgi:DNA polymerase III subunit gamma/tau